MKHEGDGQRPAILAVLLCGAVGIVTSMPIPARTAPLAPSGANAARPPATAKRDNCARLADTKIADVEIVSAVSQPAAVPVAGVRGMTGPIKGLPAFCRVIGRAHPSADSDIGFEVWLPTGGWNGRLHGVGIGGFAGLIDYRTLGTAVAGGQVGVATDTGHKGTLMTSAWAKGHYEKVKDYGYRAIHWSTVAAKALTRSFYGRGPKHSYFVGCSGGGRQGLMEAAHYPSDYDGVVAGAPAASWTDVAIAMANAVQAQLPQGAALLPKQMEFLQAEVIKQCDELDGQKDGLISEPLKCHVATSRLECGNATSSVCLSKAQVAALDRIYRGPRDASGKAVTATYVAGGAEAGYGGWEGYILGRGTGPSVGALHVDGLFQQFIQTDFPTAATFDFNKDPKRLKDILSADIDAPTNLAKFLSRGGKLILWHGWADPAIPPGATLRYYSAMRSQTGELGGRSTRLFMVPNMQHCFGGDGPTAFGQSGAPAPGANAADNIVLSLQNWVEKGRAPDAISATRGSTGYFGEIPMGPARKRLLCAYPDVAVLSPGKDSDKAESYTCKKVAWNISQAGGIT